jgi:multicomponent Na+:H+ antiporter subunit C
MTSLFVITISVIFGAGVFLLLQKQLIQVVVGLALIGNSILLAILVVGGWKVGTLPIISNESTVLSSDSIDPLPQALILTAIVIGLGMQALLLTLMKLKVGESTLSESTQMNSIKDFSK